MHIDIPKNYLFSNNTYNLNLIAKLICTCASEQTHNIKIWRIATNNTTISLTSDHQLVLSLQGERPFAQRSISVNLSFVIFVCSGSVFLNVDYTRSNNIIMLVWLMTRVTYISQKINDGDSFYTACPIELVNMWWEYLHNMKVRTINTIFIFCEKTNQHILYWKKNQLKFWPKPWLSEVKHHHIMW